MSVLTSVSVLCIILSEDGEQQWKSVYLWISICAPFGQWTMYQFYLGRFAFHCDWTGSNITMQHTDIAPSHPTGIILFLITSKWKWKKRTVKQMCWSFFHCDLSLTLQDNSMLILTHYCLLSAPPTSSQDLKRADSKCLEVQLQPLVGQIKNDPILRGDFMGGFFFVNSIHWILLSCSSLGIREWMSCHIWCWV